MPFTSLRKMITGIPWPILLILAFFLGLAPFHPQPHLVEKLSMLSAGTLRSPMDIFDLVFHTSPLVLIIAKLILSTRTSHDS